MCDLLLNLIRQFSLDGTIASTDTESLVFVVLWALKTWPHRIQGIWWKGKPNICTHLKTSLTGPNPQKMETLKYRASGGESGI